MDTNNIIIRPRWKKSKEEIWMESFENKVDSNRDDVAEASTKRISLTLLKYAAILILSVSLFGILYSIEEQAPRGQHITTYLPDNSRVMLNADSKISYKPLVWLISRNVELEGEAFFEVKRGSRFSVKSGQYKTTALGTKFNVFARDEIYSVTCSSGRVEVTVNHEIIPLTEGMKVTVSSQKPVIEHVTPGDADWMNDRFIFEDAPLYEVVTEIERQYDISISADKPLNQRYTGNFQKTERPEDALEIVGKPFGITFKIEK
ncbi:MAG: FecR domain-containing protein [Tannerella sp.]|jgi:ferric-dicitrate binding protein FerR (iron transport regulator)|nr:FecR domain-containing protein [Tannerella sp.]